MGDIREKLNTGFLFLDGGMGSMLQKAGLPAGVLPESLNISHPEVIEDIHIRYLRAGADIILTNTFGANSLKFENLEEIVKAALKNARSAVKKSGVERECYVALDIGPLGKMLKPVGDFEFEEAVTVFKNTVCLAEKYGAELIVIETMSNLYELKAAIVAAKESTSLPIFATCAFDEREKLMTGTSPEALVSFLEGIGVDALGVNCSFGPYQMKNIVERILKKASVPVIVSPNAGLPSRVNGETVYDVDCEEFSEIMKSFAKKGATVLGGCCGTTPEHIRLTAKKVAKLKFKQIKEKNITCVTGYSDCVEIGNKPVIIGERINPTGKPKLKAALKNNDISYILKEALSQQEAGADVLDVNVGLPEIDEKSMLEKVIVELQAVTEIPLQIDTSDFSAMEKAMRIYNGKPLVNSVNGKKESMEAVFPIVKKYGGTVIALTLDEKGIPETAEERVEIAKRIIACAEKYGIKKKDIIVDPLAMTVSGNKMSACVTLETVKRLHRLSIKTSLGVSNVSFGLPAREKINSVFFANALEQGLDCAIINPMNESMTDALCSFNALKGYDDNFEEYIARFSKEENFEAALSSEEISLKTAIVKGLKSDSEKAAAEELKTKAPLDIINGEIVPALDEVGKGFELNKVFLPKLLMSAEAAKSAFEVIKKAMTGDGSSKGRIILATVKGDIHDIGKNIVKVLLENYGYDVIDLGKDVPPEEIVSCAKENNIKLIGLSALMTTTVCSMEETIALAKKEGLKCKIVVGGAVLTKEYAQTIGADFYSKDAMETVRYAEKIFK